LLAQAVNKKRRRKELLSRWRVNKKNTKIFSEGGRSFNHQNKLFFEVVDAKTNDAVPLPELELCKHRVKINNI
jgi:hypothetical protein